MKRGRFLILLLLLGALSCQPAEIALTENEKSAIAAEVQQTLNDYYVAIRERGLTAEFDFLDNSTDFFWVPPGATQPLSYDSIYKILIKNAAFYKSIENSWDTLSIRPLSRDYVLYTGRLKSVMTDSTQTISTIKLIETGVMVKRGSGWKLLSGQTSVVPL